MPVDEVCEKLVLQMCECCSLLNRITERTRVRRNESLIEILLPETKKSGRFVKCSILINCIFAHLQNQRDARQFRV